MNYSKYLKLITIAIMEANANPVVTENPRKAKSQEKRENPVESPIVAVK